MITPDKLVQAGLTNAATATKVATALDEACARFGINTGKRVAGFLAQCSHESRGFRATEENLNYGAQALTALFPKYFPNAALVAEYARKPEKIANRIYGGRMGNGPEATGEGWKYRGRGFIQLTGKNNYTAFDAAMGKGGSIVADPAPVALPGYAADSAAWFWASHGLNEIADRGDIVAMTKRINGGTIGLAERTKLYQQALKVFE